jgi:hypothetical protein
VPENDSVLRTAHYTGGPEENRVKNTGEKGLDRERTARNTHSGRLRRRRRILPEYLIPDDARSRREAIAAPIAAPDRRRARIRPAEPGIGLRAQFAPEHFHSRSFTIEMQYLSDVTS